LYAIINGNQLVRLPQEILQFQAWTGVFAIPTWDPFDYLPVSKNLPYSLIELVTTASNDIVVLAYGKQHNYFAIDPSSSDGWEQF
jgi:hypothetical protein